MPGTAAWKKTFSGHSIRLVSPESSVTVGRTAWKSMNRSGSMSAKRVASHWRARYAAATVAACPPSFQPRNAEINTGRRRVGRSAMRRSSFTDTA